MEKYGVHEDDDTKTASESDKRKCPTCGSELRSVEETGVLLCPKCGSKPFEVSPNGSRHNK